MITSLKNWRIFEKNQNKNQMLLDFLKTKNFINPKTKTFIFHGTDVKPDNFNLRDDYNGEEGHTWSGDLPEGYLFLSTDINEAATYGQYVIPCELNKYDHIFFTINANNPSQVFDDDYGISLNKQTDFGFWNKFEDSGKSVLIIKGTNKKWTVITNINNVSPRIDLAKDFYKRNNI